jgi:hypothetical protein
MSTQTDMTNYTAFAGPKRIAAGNLMEVAKMVKGHFNDGAVEGVLIFDDTNSQLFDIDFRGTADDVQKRLTLTIDQQEVTAPSSESEPDTDAPRGPGRPKLGVVAREVTLLPRHWDWLNSQTGGASVALRKLVEEARRVGMDRDRIRLAQETSYRFMSAALSNEANYEEVARALFAGNRVQFNTLIDSWPIDLRDYLKQLADNAFQSVQSGEDA